MFDFKPYGNNFVSLEEFEEFLTRLVSKAVEFHQTNLGQFFAKTKVTAQGDLYNSNLNFDEFETQIVVHVDDNETNNKLVINTDNVSKSYSVECEIAINKLQNDKTDIDMKRMIAYFRKAFCFNNCKFTMQLKTDEGFSGSIYNSVLDQNKLRTITKIESNRILTFLFKITQN